MFNGEKFSQVITHQGNLVRITGRLDSVEQLPPTGSYNQMYLIGAEDATRFEKYLWNVSTQQWDYKGVSVIMDWDDKQDLLVLHSSGTAAAQEITEPRISELCEGLKFVIIPSANLSASPTLNINGLGAIPIKRRNNTNGTLYAGARIGWLTAEHAYTLVYSNGNFIVTEFDKVSFTDTVGYKHDSTSTTYGAGSKTNYGHVKLVDDLEHSTYADGEVLAASAGYKLKNLMGNLSRATNLQNGEATGSLRSILAIASVSEGSVALGTGTTAGSKCFKVVGSHYRRWRDADKNIFYSYGLVLDSTTGLELGDVVSVVIKSNYVNIGAIQQINECGDLSVANCISITYENASSGGFSDLFEIEDAGETTAHLKEELSEGSCLWVALKPTVGSSDFGINAVANGKDTIANGPDSSASGSGTHAIGKYAHTEGKKTKAGYAGHAEGTDTAAMGARSHAEGFGSEATGNHSHAEGFSFAKQEAAHSEGNNTTASGFAAHSEGSATIALAKNSHAEGYGSIAGVNSDDGDSAHAEGIETKAQGNGSHAEGKSTIASGYISHAEGNGSIATGDNSHSEGYETKAQGSASHSEGKSTTAIGNQSHAEGLETISSALQSHAEGYDTQATGDRAHSEGWHTIASGRGSHAEGWDSQAIKDGDHAEGYATAQGGYSHAEGYGTKASSQHQHVQGKYNVEDATGKYAHIVGNGTSNTNRSNAHTLDWGGNVWFAGNAEFKNSITLASPNGTKYVLSVSDDGKLVINKK